MGRRAKLAALAAAACAALAAAAAYGYQADLARERGAAFGAAIEGVQGDLAGLQAEFFAAKAAAEDGSIAPEEFAARAGSHFGAMEELLGRYGGLDTPPPFRPAVELLRLSTESQLAGDREIAELVLTGGAGHGERATELYQAALEYEAAGLRAFADLQAGRDPQASLAAAPPGIP